MKNTEDLIISGEDCKIYGIPLILYMIHALNIDMVEGKGKSELYNKIFSLDGGIYDKCRTKGEAYEGEGFHIITSEQKEQLHKIAQKIAFGIFEENNLDLKNNEYEDIVKTVSEKRLKDFGVANYYNIGNTLSFIHKSIYEYFVAENIYQEIISLFKSKKKEDLANKLGSLLKGNK